MENLVLSDIWWNFHSVLSHSKPLRFINRNGTPDRCVIQHTLERAHAIDIGDRGCPYYIAEYSFWWWDGSHMTYSWIRVNIMLVLMGGTPWHAHNTIWLFVKGWPTIVYDSCLINRWISPYSFSCPSKWTGDAKYVRFAQEATSMTLQYIRNYNSFQSNESSIHHDIDGTCVNGHSAAFQSTQKPRMNY